MARLFAGAAPLPTSEFVERWRLLPRLDVTSLRADIDSVRDQSW
ncbi:hypothetical protein [Nocardioides sp.]